MAVISSIVEGPIDEAVAIKLIEATGHIPGGRYGKRGSGYIKKKIHGFNRVARSFHYLALVDFMDANLPCPGEVVRTWLPHREPKMLFRVVVREIESWLLADHENISIFLNISRTKVPTSPELLDDPKLELVNLARKSRSQRVRAAIAPETGSRATVGKLYTSEITIFTRLYWDLRIARRNAPSLDKCLKYLEGIEGE